jgi:hypothetical protein
MRYQLHHLDRRRGTPGISLHAEAGSIGTVDGAAPSNFHITAVGRYSYSDADINDSDASGVTVDSPGAHYHNRAFYGLLRGQLDLLDGRFTNAVSAHIADTKRYSYDVADTFPPPRRPADRGHLRHTAAASRAAMRAPSTSAPTTSSRSPPSARSGKLGAGSRAGFRHPR